jgi:hypothetical protein
VADPLPYEKRHLAGTLRASVGLAVNRAHGVNENNFWLFSKSCGRIFMSLAAEGRLTKGFAEFIRSRKTWHELVQMSTPRALATPLARYELQGIVHCWKSFTVHDRGGDSFFNGDFFIPPKWVGWTAANSQPERIDHGFARSRGWGGLVLLSWPQRREVVYPLLEPLEP